MILFDTGWLRRHNVSQRTEKKVEVQVVQMVFGEHISRTFHTRRCRGVWRGKKNIHRARDWEYILRSQSSSLTRTKKVFREISLSYKLPRPPVIFSYFVWLENAISYVFRFIDPRKTITVWFFSKWISLHQIKHFQTFVPTAFIFH